MKKSLLLFKRLLPILFFINSLNLSAQANAGSNQTACTTNFTLSGSNPGTGTGQWTLISGTVSISKPSIYNTTIIADKGSNLLRWTVVDGTNVTFDDVIITNALPSAATVGPDQEICTNSTVLSAARPTIGTGFWSVIIGTGTINGETCEGFNCTAVVNTPAPGTSFFLWTTSNTYIDTETTLSTTCKLTDTIALTNASVIADAGLDHTRCINYTTLAANAQGIGQSGLWTVIAGSATIANPTMYNSTVSSLSPDINTFRWTVTKSGCSDWDEVSVINKELTVSANDDQTVCNNFATLNGQQPGVGESGLWTIEAGGGSFVDNTLHNTLVNGLSVGSNTFRWTVSNATCSATDDIKVYYNYVSSNAGLSQRICTTMTTLNATSPSAGATGNWVATLGGATVTTPTLYNSGVTDMVAGQNTFQWTVSKTVNAVTCSNATTVDIFNDAPTTATIALPMPANRETCTSTSIIQGNNPLQGTGLWTASTAATFVDATNFSTTVNNLASGANILTWSITKGTCPSSAASMTLTNNEVLAQAGADQNLCDNFTNLVAIDPTTVPPSQGTGVWTRTVGTGIIANSLLNATGVSNLSLGVNTFRWTVTQGICSDFDDVNINYNGITATATNQTTCTGTVTLDGNIIPGASGLWTETPAGPGTITDPTLGTTTVTGIPNESTLSYTWKVTLGACSDNITIAATNNNFALSAGPDVTICTTSYNMVGDHPAPGTGLWALSGGSGSITTPTLYNTGITGLGSGNNTFTWTVTKNGCSNTSDVTILNSSPSTPEAGPNQFVCSNAVLAATKPIIGTGQWTLVAGGAVLVNPTSHQTEVFGLLTGYSVLRWTVTNDMCSYFDDVIILNNAPNVSTGYYNRTCKDSYTLNGSIPGGELESGIWTLVQGEGAIIETPTLYNTRVTNLPLGKSTFKWSVTNQYCTASADEIVNNIQALANAGETINTCIGNTTLNGNNPMPNRGEWTLLSGTAAIYTPTLFNSIIDFTGSSATFQWTVYNAKCSESDTVIVNNNNVPLVGSLQEICSSSATLNASPLSTGQSGFWTSMNPNPIISNSLMPETNVSNLEIGENIFYWTVTNQSGCKAVAEHIIKNNSITTSAGTNETICTNYTTLKASPLSATASGLWSGGASINIVSPNSATTNVTNLSQGANTFTWTVTNKGCTATSTVQVTNNSFTANAGTDQISTVNNATMTAQLPDVSATGGWSVYQGMGSIAEPNLPTSIISGLSYGVNTFRWNVYWRNCTAFDDVNIIYDAITAEAGPLQTICAGNTFMSAMDPYPGTGTWSLISGSGNFADSRNRTTQVSNIEKGSQNTYRWTVEINGYSENDDVIITNGEFNISAGIDMATCDDKISLAADEAIDGIGAWSILAGAGIFENHSDNNSLVTSLGDGVNIFVWTVSKNTGCSDSDTVTAMHNIKPSSSFTANKETGCAPLTIDFTNTSSGSANYYWDFIVARANDESLQNHEIIFTAKNGIDSSYMVKLIAYSQSGCSDTTSMEIKAIAVPNLNFTANPTTLVYPDATISIENLSNPNYNYYLWDFGDGDTLEEQSFSANLTHTYSTWGEYILSLTAKNGECSNNYTFNSIVIQEPTSIENLAKAGIKFYPNPSKGKVNIEFENINGYKSLYITTLSGQKVMKKDITTSKESFDLSELGMGVYLINIQHIDKTIRAKVIIQK